MSSDKSVLIVDNSDIDNFINHKILESIGITDVVFFKSVIEALFYLKSTKTKYDLILVEIYLPKKDGFEFIDQFRELKLNETHGKICVLSASISPMDKEKVDERNIKFLSKPLTVDILRTIINE